VPRTDAIVVGASYAGLAAALQFPGRRVVVFERNESITHRQRACLGVLFGDSEFFEPRGEDLFLRPVRLLVEGGCAGTIERLAVQGQRERAEISLSRSWPVANPERLKGALLRRARDMGVEVRTGFAVRQLIGDGREVRARGASEEAARVLIGADGTNSLVARWLDPHREALGILFAREVEFERWTLAPKTLFLQCLGVGHFLAALPGTDRHYAWMLHVVGPKGVPLDLDSALQDSVERLGGGRITAAREAVTRLFAPASLSRRDNVLLAGDAVASFGISGIGAAVAMGALAGRAANRYLSGSRYALPDYHRRWRRVTRQATVERVLWAQPLLARLDPDRVDSLLRAMKGRRRSSVIPAGDIVARLPAMLLGLFL